MFGTFEEEQEKVVYGLVKPIDSINPLVAFLHGFYRLGKGFWEMPGFRNKLGFVFGPPGWKPKNAQRPNGNAD